MEYEGEEHKEIGHKKCTTLRQWDIVFLRVNLINLTLPPVFDFHPNCYSSKEIFPYIYM